MNFAKSAWVKAGLVLFLLLFPWFLGRGILLISDHLSLKDIFYYVFSGLVALMLATGFYLIHILIETKSAKMLYSFMYALYAGFMIAYMIIWLGMTIGESYP